MTGTFGLSTSRGDVHINAATGSALVDVRNGNIAVSFRAPDRALPSAFATLNGNVDISGPNDAGFALDARCRGCTARAVPGDSLHRTRLAGRTQQYAIIAAHGLVQRGRSRSPRLHLERRSDHPPAVARHSAVRRVVDRSCTPRPEIEGSARMLAL